MLAGSAASGQISVATAVPVVSATAVAPGVERIESVRFPVTAAAAHVERRGSYAFRVPANGWYDTGLDVVAGENIAVTADGSVTLADGRVVGPDGTARGWRDLLHQFPANDANTGALVGRVSDAAAAVPFQLGANGTATMSTSGRLFLAVNTYAEQGGSGEFSAKLTFPKPAADAVAPAQSNAGVAASMVPVRDLAGLVSPGTFDAVPRRVADNTGTPGDMVNFALVGTQEQVEKAFAAAGWAPVDKNVTDAVLHGLLATLNHETYTSMPMSTLYLFGRPQDLSFARGDAVQVAAVRHHLRVWQTTMTVAGAQLWVGAATHDVGFERDTRGHAAGDVAGYTHKIDPDVDLERTFLLQSFDAAGVFRAAAYVTPHAPLRTAQTATGEEFHSDGRVLVMALP